MKTAYVEGVVKSAFGRPLSFYKKEDGTPFVKSGSVSFKGPYQEYETAEEVKKLVKEDGTSAWPSDEDIVKMLNDNKKAAARTELGAKAIADAGIEKPPADDPQVVHAGMVKQLMLGKKSREDAIRMATLNLGWDENGVMVAEE
jgi:Aldehyde:ferredoxin oxidoreductase